MQIENRKLDNGEWEYLIIGAKQIGHELELFGIKPYNMPFLSSKLKTAKTRIDCGIYSHSINNVDVWESIGINWPEVTTIYSAKPEILESAKNYLEGLGFSIVSANHYRKEGAK